MISLSNAKRFLGLSDKEVSITGNGTVAICTATDHNLKVGDQVEIKYTTSYDGVYTIIQRDANTFRFAKATVTTTESGLIVPHDFKLQLILDGVEGFVNRYTNNRWSDTTTQTEIIDCPDDGIITDLMRTVASISSLKVSADRDFDTSGKYTSLTSSDYFLYASEGKLELKGSVADSVFGTRKTVKITYTTGSLPKELVKASYDLLRYFYQIENDKASNLVSRTNNSEQIVFEKEIPRYITEQLDPFRKVKIGSFARSPRPVVI